MQDAHEFLNYLLNELGDILEKEAKAAKTDNKTSSSPEKISNGPKLLQPNGAHKEPTVTWVHKIFQVIKDHCIFIPDIYIYGVRFIAAFSVDAVSFNNFPDHIK